MLAGQDIHGQFLEICQVLLVHLIQHRGILQQSDLMLLQRIAAYETLVKAQNKFIDYDETLLEEAMKALESQLGHLSADAVNAYYMILEYMEQPYLGQ